MKPAAQGTGGNGRCGGNGMIDIWREEFTVKFGAVDRSDRLTLAAVFDVFQEMAINHAENLGAGRGALAAARQGWVLSRMSVVADSRPKWGETLTARSWPRGADRLFAVRDYDILNGDRALIRGRGGWLILDLDRRRPLRVQPIVGNFPQNEGINALPGSPPGLDAKENLEKTGERRAAYSDIDYNGHMNNVRYISWIQDLAGAEILEKADRARLDINYLGEIRYGETIELWIAAISPALPDGNGAYGQALAFEGRRVSGGQAVFRAELRTG